MVAELFGWIFRVLLQQIIHHSEKIISFHLRPLFGRELLYEVVNLMQNLNGNKFGVCLLHLLRCHFRSSLFSLLLLTFSHRASSAFSTFSAFAFGGFLIAGGGLIVGGGFSG